MFSPCNKWIYIALIASAAVTLVECDHLLRRGWYRTKNGLKMGINNVTHIDGNVVPDASYLRISARIPTFHPGAIRNLRNVSTLKFSFCGIRDINPGAFVNLSGLTTLALHDNDIEHVRFGVFNNLTVSVLYLQRNEISTIDTEAFDDMPNIYRLKINSNKISVWDGDWFKNSPRVTELFFRRNEIREIPAGAFRNVRGSHKSNGTRTVDTKIFLSKNNITSVNVDAFEGLDELSQLFLDRNRLRELDERVFFPLRQIGVIFLSKNQLTGLPKNLLAGLRSDVLTLDLAGNNNMTCVPYEIVAKVKITNLQDVRRLDCECVDELVGRLARDKKFNEIQQRECE